MREIRDWRKRKGKPLTPEILMRILNQAEGGERAQKAYKEFTGLNPPPEDGEIMQGDEDENNDSQSNV